MEKPIRILHILQRMEAGGTQALLMNLYRNIDREKVQFDFLVHYKEKQFYDDEIKALGGEIYYFSVREDFKVLKYVKELKKFFREHKEYRVVHGHMFTLGWIYLYVAKKSGVKVRIAHSHANQSERNWKVVIKNIIKRLNERNATDLFACSKEAGEYLFKSKDFQVLNNAIDAKKFQAENEVRQRIRRELGVEDQFVIGHVGRFQPAKNHGFLIDIFEEIKKERPDAVLLLVGTGDLEDKVKEKVKKLGLADAVKFLGNRRNMNEIYQAMDVFLLPSHFEGLGIVAIEAQAAGIPCLCSDTTPTLVEISPLMKRISLEEGAKRWADLALEQGENEYAHQNMYDYVVCADFDICSQAKRMEDFYLKKYMEES